MGPLFGLGPSAALAALSALLLYGCPSAYVAGSLDAYASGAPPGSVSATGECIELRISEAEESEVPAGYLILEYELGNRCRHPAAVHLGRAQVVLHGMAGLPERMPVFDPSGELVEATLDGRHSAWERLAYRLPDGEPEEPPPVEEVCIELSELARGLVPERLCIPGAALHLRWAAADERGENEGDTSVLAPRVIKKE